MERAGLPVTLSAEQENHVVLVLQLVGKSRLADGSAGCDDRADHLLIQMFPGQITREGQVLDRSPTRDDASLRNVVVGIAGGDTARSSGDGLERTSKREPVDHT